MGNVLLDIHYVRKDIATIGTVKKQSMAFIVMSKNKRLGSMVVIFYQQIANKYSN